MTRNDRPERSRTFTWADPMQVADALRNPGRMRALEAWAEGRAAGAPICELMNIRLAEVSEGRVVFTGRPEEYHYNPMGTVHGGFAAALIDSATGLAVASVLPEDKGWTTIDLNVSFVRAMTAATGPVRCEADIVHKGSRLVTAQARVTDADGKLYAHGSTTCLVLEWAGKRQE